MNLGTKLLVFFNLILLFIGFAGIIAGAGGDSWWEGGVIRSYKESLLTLCDGQTECERRKDILGFKENQRDKDAILIVLIVSIITTFAAVVNLMVLTSYCREDEEKWKCGALMLTLFSFSAAVSGLGPVIYAEVQFDDKFDIHNHGWSIIFAWIGACCLALSFILSFVLMFNGPQETHPKEIMRSDSTYPLPM
ncbi:uncharacterized protein [Clytia hemisphaerica]